jgi:hypothetical protein
MKSTPSGSYLTSPSPKYNWTRTVSNMP